MPLVIVTAEHPSETDLLDLATGREAGDATAAAKKHVDAGCRLCARRLADLEHLVWAVKEENAFDAILEDEAVPELPRQAMGRTLPFVKAKARTSVEDIYRLSQAAEKPAELIIDAARAGADELAAAMRSLDGQPYRGFALLYAAQKADKLVAEDPKTALRLAELLFTEASALPEANRDGRLTTPAPRQAVQAEATILKSHALLQTGEADSALAAIEPARELFRQSGDLGFGEALCDYYEGQAAGFAKDYGSAEKKLKRALSCFAEFGQDNLVARAEAALGTLCLQRGDDQRALHRLDRAIQAFDPERDAQPLAMTLNNRANALARLERFDEARAGFARALRLAHTHGFTSIAFFVRNGLAELDFRRARYKQALRAFAEIAREAAATGSPMEVLFARLHVAECLGHLGDLNAMAAEIDGIRRERQANRFAPSPALGELFVCLDQDTIDADLIAHVRVYLQDEENGVKRAYRPLRLVG
jgi:tetratricopeptide (TPR) repeat protein